MQGLLTLAIQPSLAIRLTMSISKDHGGGSECLLSGLQIAFALAIKDQNLSLSPYSSQVPPHPQ